MAGRSEYIEEAYRELERMSADERARLEYKARQKAIRDHEAIMSSAWNRGLQEGRDHAPRRCHGGGSGKGPQLVGLAGAEVYERSGVETQKHLVFYNGV